MAGIAVQSGNLADRDPATGKPVTAAELYLFAKDRLRLDYVLFPPHPRSGPRQCALSARALAVA